MESTGAGVGDVGDVGLDAEGIVEGGCAPEIVIGTVTEVVEGGIGEDWSNWVLYDNSGRPSLIALSLLYTVSFCKDLASVRTKSSNSL